MREVVFLICSVELQEVVATIAVVIGFGHGIRVGDNLSLGLESQPHCYASQDRQFLVSWLPEEIVQLRRS